MARNICVRAVREREVDADKLAVAFLLLSKILFEQEQADVGSDRAATDGDTVEGV